MFIKVRHTFFRPKLLSLLALFLFVTIVHETAFAAYSGTKLSALKVPGFSQATTGGYKYLGNAHGQGDILNSMVGPGVSASKQMFYLNYIYNNGKMDFVAIDPNSGHYRVYPSPVKNEQGAWGLAVGPDKNMYLGTLLNAHLLKFNTSLQQLTDLGQVPLDPGSSTPQSYIWQLTVSPHNHKIYGCTYPSADLVSYDPLAANPKIVNLGTMDPTHQDMYARACVADPNPNSPYIYLGLGTVSDQIVVYNTDTNSITLRINGSSASSGWVYPGSDGNVHSWLLNGSNYQYYMLSNGGYTQSGYTQAAPTNVLNDGSTITVNATTITINHPDKSTKTYLYTYAGRNLSIFRIGLGPDGKVYGGTVLPYDFFTYDPGHSIAGVQMKGKMGDGEPYSLLAYNQLLYIAAYKSPNLEIYDPSKPFDITTNPLNIPSGNFQADLRPQAMVGAPDHKLYIGAIASYGKLTGPLITWNTQNNSDIQEYFPIQNQGVVSLTPTSGACQDSSGSYCIIGGTTIYGGGGTTPLTSSAQLFSWNPTSNTVIHQYTIPQVSNPNTITDLVTNPANGYVYGIATSSSGNYIFAFNPRTGTFIDAGTKLPFSGAIYNSVAIYNGKIWGLSAQGVFNINPNNASQATLIPSSSTITAGFAMNGKTMYFASNSKLWSYTIS